MPHPIPQGLPPPSMGHRSPQRLRASPPAGLQSDPAGVELYKRRGRNFSHTAISVSTTVQPLVRRGTPQLVPIRFGADCSEIQCAAQANCHKIKRRIHPFFPAVLFRQPSLHALCYSLGDTKFQAQKRKEEQSMIDELLDRNEFGSFIFRAGGN